MKKNAVSGFTVRKETEISNVSCLWKANVSRKKCSKNCNQARQLTCCSVRIWLDESKALWQISQADLSLSVGSPSMWLSYQSCSICNCNSHWSKHIDLAIRHTVENYSKNISYPNCQKTTADKTYITLIIKMFWRMSIKLSHNVSQNPKSRRTM